jgi:flagellar hook-basal body complex protein FliE
MTGFLPIEALASLSPAAQNVLSAANANAVGVSAPPMLQAADGSFGKLVTDGIAQVNSRLVDSQTDLQKLAMGDAQNLHQIMMNLEESRLSFQLMMQVRSRLLEAYQDIMKMPI